MALYAEPDQYKVGTIVNGLPTCTFPPREYNRKVTAVVVGNTVNSTANVFRGLLGSTPVATTLLGINNTLLQRINIPAGQPFYVQWSVAGPGGASDAFARVSLVRDDNPLEGSDLEGSGWTNSYQRSLSVPPSGFPSITFGADVPAAVVALVHSQFGATYNAFACVLYQEDATHYWFDVAAVDTSTVPGSLVIARGIIGAVNNISQYWFYNIFSNTTSLALGNGPFDAAINLGAIAGGAEVDILGNPSNRVDINASTAVQLLLNSVVKLRMDSTAIHLENSAVLAIESGTMLDVNAGSSFFVGNNQVNGASIAYAPVLSNWTKGNGIFNAKYRYLSDHLVMYWGEFTVGTTTVAAGDFNISLPVIPFLSPSTIGAAYVNQNSSGKSWPSVVALFGSIAFLVAVTNNVSVTNPFAPAANDMYIWTIIYEI